MKITHDDEENTTGLWVFPRRTGIPVDNIREGIRPRAHLVPLQAQPSTAFVSAFPKASTQPILVIEDRRRRVLQMSPTADRVHLNETSAF